MNFTWPVINIIGMGLMGFVGIANNFKDEKGKLTRKGIILFILGVAFTIFSSLISTYCNVILGHDNEDKSTKISLLNDTLVYKNNKLTQSLKESHEKTDRLFYVLYNGYKRKNVNPNINNTVTNNLQIITKDTKLGWRPKIEGSIIDVSKKVYLIVRPKKLQEYWVQPNVSVNSDKTWSCIPYIGQPSQDINEVYEIRAIANPKTKIEEGDVFNNWPEAEWYSNIITVTRE